MPRQKLALMMTVCLLIGVVALAQDDKQPAPPAVKIGFNMSYNPTYTLTGHYSMLKNYLENEFGTTVEAVAGGWSNLSQYDVFIIPGHYLSSASTADCISLRQWIRQGGVCIVMWYIDWAGWHAGSGATLEVNVLIELGTTFKATAATSANMVTVVNPYGNSPYTVNSVFGPEQTGEVAFSRPEGKALGYSDTGQIIAGYAKADQGYLFVLGNMFAYQDASIDGSDGKELIFNIIHNAAGDGGGGGGGDKPDLWPKVVKGRKRTLSVGDNFKMICRVKNKGKAAAAASKVYFYLSPDQTYDASDIEMGSADVPALNKNKSKKVKKTVLIPATVAPGVYYLVAFADKDDGIDESDETNNEKAFAKQITIQ